MTLAVSILCSIGFVFPMNVLYGLLPVVDSGQADCKFTHFIPIAGILLEKHCKERLLLGLLLAMR